MRRGPLRHLADVETITMLWVHWYNTTRLHSLLNYASPEDFEAAYYASIANTPTRPDDPDTTTGAVA